MQADADNMLHRLSANMRQPGGRHNPASDQPQRHNPASDQYNAAYEQAQNEYSDSD